jgi:hypothetical protein
MWVKYYVECSKRTLQKKLYKPGLIVACLSLPNYAYANTGIPIIAIIFPLSWILLIPIIVIEWFVMMKYYPFLRKSHVLYVSIITNITSTLVGIPLAWGLMLLIELIFLPLETFFPSNLNKFWQYFLNVTLGSAWLMPYEDQLYWMIPTALIILLIPCFIISCWLESFVASKILKGAENNISLSKLAVYRANLASYLFLLFSTIIFLCYNLMHQ